MGTGKTYSTKYLLDSNNSSGVAGQVLSTTSTGIDWVDANTVPGTGLWLANGNDIYNSNSGNVGIGLTNPAVKLHIKGVANGTDGKLYITEDVSNGSFFKYDGATNRGSLGGLSTGGEGMVIDWSRTGSEIRLLTGNNERMRIDSAGNVQFSGATSNTTVISMNTTDGSDTKQLSLAGGGADTDGQGARMRLFGNEHATNGGVVDLSTGNIAGSDMHLRAKDLMLLYTNSSERMRITSGGNVGIGTTGPRGKLQINGNGNAWNDAPSVRLWDTTNGKGWLVGNVNNYTAGDFYIRTFSSVNTDPTSSSQEFTIKHATGNVGIGTASPSSLLSVGVAAVHNNPSTTVNIATADTGSYLLKVTSNQFNVDGNWVGIGLGYSNNYMKMGIIAEAKDNNGRGKLHFAVNTTAGSSNASISDAKITIDNSGNVGIGTTSPRNDSAFVTLQVGSTVTAASQIVLDDNDSNGPWRIISNQSLIINDDATERMRINASGNVGIGTTSPNNKLDIYSNENVPLRIHRPNNSNLDSAGAFGIGFSTRGDAITSTTDTRAGLFSYYNGNLFLAANNTRIDLDPDSYARLTILNTGSIKFNAYNSTNQTGTPTYILGTDASGNVVKVLGGDIPGGGGTVTGTGTTDRLTKFTDGPNGVIGDSGISDSSNALAITINGNEEVGIGQPTPFRKLHVNSGTTNVVARFESTDTTAAIEFKDNNGSAEVGNTGDNLVFFPAGAEKMRIDSSGRVGIGVTPYSWSTSFDNIQIGNKISLWSASNNGGLSYNQYYNGTNNIYQTNDTANRFQMDADGFHFYQAASGTAGNTATFSEPMRITTGGKVGIGITPNSSYSNLQIKTPSSAYGLDLVGRDAGSSSESQITFWNAAQSSVLAAIYNITSNLYFYTNGDNRMIINSSGNVGIGTTSPVSAWLSSFDPSTGNGTFKLTSEGWVVTPYLTGLAGYYPGQGARPIIWADNAGTNIQSWDNSATDGVSIRSSNKSVRLFVREDGNVGIGTTSPDAILETSKEVDGNQVGALLTNTRQAGTADSVSLNFGLGRTADGFIFNTPAIKFLKEQQWTGTGSTVDGSLVFSTIQNETVAERMRIFSNGNVNIGVAETGSSAVTGPFVVTHGSSRFLTGSFEEGLISLNAKNNNNTLESLRIAGDTIQLWTGTGTIGSIKVKILNNGNVGIGDTNPTNNLSVVGSIGTDDIFMTATAASSSGTAFVVNEATQLVTRTAAQVLADIGAAPATGGAYLPLAGGTMTGTIIQNGGNIDFSDGRSANFGNGDDLQIFHNGSHSFVTNGTGDLNLSTTSGGLYLTQFKDDGDIILQCDDGSGGVSNYLTLDGSTTHVYFSNPGNVGIGTTSPSEKLTLQLDSQNQAFSGKNGTDYLWFLRNEAGAGARQSGRFQLMDTDVTTVNIESASNRNTYFNAGNVGIGTTSPSTKLEVYNGNLRVRGDQNAFIELSNIAGNTKSQLGNAGNEGDLSLFTSGNAKTVYLSSYYNSYINPAGGNVGIGVTDPEKKLEVKSDTTYDGIMIDVLSAPEITFRDRGNSDTRVGTGRHALDGFHIDTYSGNALLIKGSNRFVGIGTTSPSQKLHVVGKALITDDVQLTGSNPRIDFNTNGVSSLRFFDTSNATERMRITSDGDVGIGKTNPVVKLDVSDEVSGSGFTNGVVRFENSIEDSTGGAGVLNIQNNYQGGFGTLIKFWYEESSIASINFNSSTNAVVYNTTSDYRLKEDLKSFNGLEIIDQIKTYNYKWKKADARGYGALAHELQEVFPDAVTGEKDGEDMQGVDYSTLVPVLIKSIQELKAEIELLKQK